MIYKVSLALLLPLLLLSFALAFAGVEAVGGNSYYNLLQALSIRYGEFRIDIPNIPYIDKFDDVSLGTAVNVFDYLKVIANFFIVQINILIGVANIFVIVLNVILDVVEFAIRLFRTIKDFIVGNLEVVYLARTIV